jgi:hypothetical protein
MSKNETALQISGNFPYLLDGRRTDDDTYKGARGPSWFNDAMTHCRRTDGQR